MGNIQSLALSLHWLIFYSFIAHNISISKYFQFPHFEVEESESEK